LDKVAREGEKPKKQGGRVLAVRYVFLVRKRCPRAKKRGQGGRGEKSGPGQHENPHPRGKGA